MPPQIQVGAPHPGEVTPPLEGDLTFADPHVEFADPPHQGQHSIEEFTRNNAILKEVLWRHAADIITTTRKQG